MKPNNLKDIERWVREEVERYYLRVLNDDGMSVFRTYEPEYVCLYVRGGDLTGYLETHICAPEKMVRQDARSLAIDMKRRL